MVAIGDHLRLGPGFGMSAKVDLRWRIGAALTPVGKTRMPYKSVMTKFLADRLSQALGPGYSSTMLYDARRLHIRYPRRGNIPSFAMWTDLRRFIAKIPPRGRPKQDAKLRRPGLIELRRLMRRAVQIWTEGRWLELPCKHPAALRFIDGDVVVVIRIIQPKLRYVPMPEVDDNAKTVIEMCWSDRPVIRCRHQHRLHSQINVKELRRIVVDP